MVDQYVMATAAILTTLTLALVLARLFAGPTLYDRTLAVNAFGTKTVIFLCLFAFWIDRPDAVDIAMLYALLNFIATIAILKFFRYRTFGSALLNAGDDEADEKAKSQVHS